MDTTSFWSDTTPLQRFKKLDQDYHVDVVIIGAGITGVTAAYLLKKAGCKVALIERGRCGGFDTTNTTAHLTCVTDTRLSALAAKFGNPTAKATWEGGRAAIDQIVKNIHAEKISCDFTWVPGYYHAPLNGDAAKERRSLEAEAKLANDLGFAAEFLDSVPLVNQPGVKFLHQAKFNPLAYVAALLRTIPGNGSHVFEKTEAGKISDRPLSVTVGKHQIHCSYLFLATHTPLMGNTDPVSALLFQSKLFLYTSYAISTRIRPGSAPEASFWDTAEPYHYLRIDRHRDFDEAIFGGEDNKTGQIKNPAQPYRNLEKTLKKILPTFQADHQWSGQVVETPDGLPYMGETAPRQFVATGFGGNGMTFGTLGAMMAVDAFLKRKNPWAELFDVHRKPFHGGTGKYLRENKDYPYYLLRNWLGGARDQSVKSLKRNSGKVLHLQGRKVAAYRDPQGKLSLCSPVCTHLQCIVKWNDTEKTWDCPCHGSRFAATGEVLAGPAEKPLEKIDTKELAK
ncbi:MAG TPA: FAD-dependent oxidoreductase [Verrucomicrobiae bacterium]|jgi:glycine/D-amino acid oxidase-like deaminating enzyme/nitrite reductase/ring-hydroxylating ferredoxin subunit